MIHLSLPPSPEANLDQYIPNSRLQPTQKSRVKLVSSTTQLYSSLIKGKEGVFGQGQERREA